MERDSTRLATAAPSRHSRRPGSRSRNRSTWGSSPLRTGRHSVAVLEKLRLATFGELMRITRPYGKGSVGDLKTGVREQATYGPRDVGDAGGSEAQVPVQRE